MRTIMLGSLAQHSFVAVLLAIVVEELGIPMPIPTDVLIVFVGTGASGSVPELGLFLVMLTVASSIGASGLYAIVRRGGRTLVERYGRYVHLGPKQLARSEALIARGGWGTTSPSGVPYRACATLRLSPAAYSRYLTHVS